MLDWIKTQLGENYTDEIETSAKKELAKWGVPKSEFNAKVKQVGELEKTILEQTTELDNLRKANADVAGYEQKLKDKDAAHAAEINALKVDFAGINHMRELGARDPEIAWELAKRKLEDPKLNAEGKIEGIDDAGDAVKAEKAYMFFDEGSGGLEVDGAKPAQPGNKGNSTDKNPKDMTYDELCEYLAKNPNANLN